MIIASFLIGILCGMGLGSGGLFVVYLTVALGFEQLYAQALNLYFFIFSSFFALFVHIKKQKIKLKRLFFVCALGSVGCVFGAIVAQRLRGELLRNIFAFFLIGTGIFSLCKEKSPTEKP